MDSSDLVAILGTLKYQHGSQNGFSINIPVRSLLGPTQTMTPATVGSAGATCPIQPSEGDGMENRWSPAKVLAVDLEDMHGVGNKLFHENR